MRTILLLFCCLSAVSVIAQNYITLQGKIIDNKTGDERLKASFGQLYLLDDLEQTLRSTEPFTTASGITLANVGTAGPFLA